MKVTVCFGNIRVIVPCGRGDMTVGELQKRACIRYRKAIGKNADYMVTIQQLGNAVDGGILDWDDEVADVVEDKEKLIAIYNEECEQDGSDYRSVLSSEESHLTTASSGNNNSQTIALSDFNVGNYYEANETHPNDYVTGNGYVTDHTHMENRKPPQPAYSVVPLASPTHHKPGGVGNFRRNASYQSMGKGALQDDDLMYRSVHPALPHFNPAQPRFNASATESELHDDFASLPWWYRESQEIALLNDGSPLGIEVAEFAERGGGKLVGLRVERVVAGSRAQLSQLFARGDVVVEVDRRLLANHTFDQALAILDDSRRQVESQFRVVPVEEMERHTSHRDVTNDRTSKQDEDVASPRSEMTSSSSSSSTNHMSSNGRVPHVARQTYDNMTQYTRKIGSRINIQLTKDFNGLGFSITTRDTTIGDAGPIYIKHILPKGAAIDDGRLQAGDRLMEVNGTKMTGLTQEQAAGVLRQLPCKTLVHLVVSRHKETLPRKMKPDASQAEAPIAVDEAAKTSFMFEIALNDSGSAGLGISLKGNQSKRTGKDLGIFVKSIFHGGAAWQDGRLQPNDQLIEVNNSSLSNVSNQDAIEILRNSMSTEGNIRGMIQMVVLRHNPNVYSTPVASSSGSDVAESVPSTARSKSESNQDSNSNRDDDDSNFDSFNRDSFARQSISEKRKGKLPASAVMTSAMMSPSRSKKRIEERGDVTMTSLSPQNRRKVAAPAVKPRNTNNNSTRSGTESKAGAVVAPKQLRKSNSTESLMSISNNNPATGLEHRNSAFYAENHFQPISVQQQGMGDKSLSLESMVAIGKQDHMPPAEPAAKGPAARNRILNDSFRAALEMNSVVPDSRNSHQYDMEEKSAQFEQPRGKSKFFGFLKKGRKTTYRVVNSPPEAGKPSERQVHKRTLAQNREKDFKRLQDENKRIQACAEKLRSKQNNVERDRSLSSERHRSPSVPLLSMLRIDDEDAHNRSSQRPMTSLSQYPPTSSRHQHPLTTSSHHQQSMASSHRHQNSTTSSHKGPPPTSQSQPAFASQATSFEPPMTQTRVNKPVSALRHHHVISDNQHDSQRNEDNNYSSLPSRSKPPPPSARRTSSKSSSTTLTPTSATPISAAANSSTRFRWDIPGPSPVGATSSRRSSVNMAPQVVTSTPSERRARPHSTFFDTHKPTSHHHHHHRDNIQHRRPRTLYYDDTSDTPPSQQQNQRFYVVNNPARSSPHTLPPRPSHRRGRTSSRGDSPQPRRDKIHVSPPYAL